MEVVERLPYSQLRLQIAASFVVQQLVELSFIGEM